MPAAATIPVLDALKALAFIGDLSMGQPVDHSRRTAWLAGRIAQAAGLDERLQGVARQVALMRWSGCTANAPEVAEMLDDDVRGREAFLAEREPQVVPASGLEALAGSIISVVQIHCEVSGDIASMLGVCAETEEALRCIFETFDGRGVPGRRQGTEVPAAVYIAGLAGDLEIFSRLYGVDQALALVARKADRQYPADLVACVTAGARAWLAEVEAGRDVADELARAAPALLRPAPLELVADVVDLKLPWMTGLSRHAARLARDCCAQLGLDEAAQQRAYRAGLIHGIGRAAVPNAIWNAPGPLSESAWERVRLVPYWTSRALRQIGALASEADIASFAFERVDGSGYFRGVSGPSIPLEAQALAAAVEWASASLPKPGRALAPVDARRQELRAEAAAGRFDDRVVAALLDAVEGRREAPAPRDAGISLSAREVEVLRRISQGDSNKEAARELGISASTVRTHVESVFRKLGCSTRAAATLKASTLGLL